MQERIYYWSLYFGDDYGLNSIAAAHLTEMDGELDTEVTFTLQEVKRLNDLFDKNPAPLFDRGDRFEAQNQLKAYSDNLKAIVRDERG